MSDQNQAQEQTQNVPTKKAWYNDIEYKNTVGYSNIKKITEWIGLIITIVIGIYAFYIMHQLSK